MLFLAIAVDSYQQLHLHSGAILSLPQVSPFRLDIPSQLIYKALVHVFRKHHQEYK